MHTAAKEGYKYTVEYLVMKGADISLKDKDGVSTSKVIHRYGAIKY